MTANRDRAEAVLLEILRQTGSEGLGRIKLYKAFWLAHLYYTQDNPGYLSDWPIVRMPQGPGVDQGESLIRGLVAGGKVSQGTEWVGPFREYRCRYALPVDQAVLPAAAVAAVTKAVEYVRGKTAADLSEMSHDYSRSWRETPDGRELDIYSDLIPDEEYEERKRAVAGMNAAYDEMFG